MIAVPDAPGALDSDRVLDLATYLAAPVCATLLGEFGAEVIKVEQPRVGDDLRRLGRAAGPDAGGSYWWFVESRNKKSITCNLRDPEGQGLIRRLVAESHVLTENFRPGTLERWNLGWEALSAIRMGHLPAGRGEFWPSEVALVEDDDHHVAGVPLVARAGLGGLAKEDSCVRRRAHNTSTLSWTTCRGR